jgi:NAD(P)-dependent dehydrogenase (short-subunit alcohol dehydrogenase family)
VRLFTKSVALECAAAKDGVRVNSLHPGITETAIWDTLIGTVEDGTNGGRERGPTLDKLTERAVPLGFKAAPEDIANGILWLASDESRYVTGTELVIDGGRSIG